MAKKAKKILIIEDEKALAKNLKMALEDEYDVSVAVSGKEGLKKAHDEQPDLILLDIMLPDISGYEVLAKLKEDDQTNDIDIIVSTNLGDPETVSKIVAAGGRDYIVKSDWKIEDIVKKIKNVIGE